jgi:CubicO group peptidase (beta-lactamase class C family)
MSVQGETAKGFERVRDAFDEHANEMGRGGAAFAAYQGGKKIVDLWGGSARPGVDWTRDTVSCFFSSTKMLTGVVAMLLHDRGQLDFDVPVMTYWPEFAANGKEAVTVRQLLSMQAGFPYVPGYEDFLSPSGEGWDQTEEIERRIAESAPLTEVGKPAYALVNFGLLVNAVVRRISGRHVKDIWNDDIARPLGVDLWLGGRDDVRARAAQLYNFVEPGLVLATGTLGAKAWHEVNGRSVLDDLAAFASAPTVSRSLEGGGESLGTAAAMAKVYAMLENGGSLDGVKILTPATVSEFTEVQSREPDEVIAALGTVAPSNWLLGGIECNYEMEPGLGMIMGPGPRSFGKAGAGGQNGFADPDHKLGVAFIRSQLTWTSPLERELVDALYTCL